MATILIVDDEPNMRRILATNLGQAGYEVVEASGVLEGKKAIADPLDAIITDQKMDDGLGLDVLAAARQADPRLSVVFLTAFATVELAVESMRKGAFDVITKPFSTEILLATAR
jgi:DNA-binding NtrC family response regulator